EDCDHDRVEHVRPLGTRCREERDEAGKSHGADVEIDPSFHQRSSHVTLSHVTPSHDTLSHATPSQLTDSQEMPSQEIPSHARPSAAAPVAIAVDAEVPVRRAYGAAGAVSAPSRSSAVPGTRSETMCSPGARTSGFAKPSRVGPRLEKIDSRSSFVARVPWSANEPTVMTNGSAPGIATVPWAGPSLPAAATTATPANHADSTTPARSSRS